MRSAGMDENHVYFINTATKNALEYSRAFFFNRQNYYAK
jgi:hypothetical protein